MENNNNNQPNNISDKLSRLNVFTGRSKETLVDKSPKYAPTSTENDRPNRDKSTLTFQPPSPTSDQSSPTSPTSPRSVPDKQYSDSVGPIDRSAEQIPAVDQPQPKVLPPKSRVNRAHSPSPEKGGLKIPRPLKVKRTDIENPDSAGNSELENRPQPRPSNETEENNKIGVATAVETQVEQGAGESEPRHSMGVSVPTPPSKNLTSTDFPPAGVVLLVAVSIYTTGIFLVKVATGEFLEEQKDKKEEIEKIKRQPPSFFISTFLTGDQVILDQFLIATRILKGENEKVKKGMIGQIVAIIDKTQKWVLIEMFAEDYYSFDEEKIHVSAFIKLPIIGQIKKQATRSLQFLQEVFKLDKIGAFFFS